MAREKKVSVAAINIRIHPEHRAALYVDLFKTANALNRAIAVWGETHLKLTFFKEDEAAKVIRGSIAKYTEIDTAGSWFNAETNAQVDETEQDKIKIPEMYKPNYAGFNFIFYPKEHLFVFEIRSESKTLSPNFVKTFLERLFEAEEITEKFGVVDLTVLPRKDKISAILKMPTLTFLEITILRPNPDSSVSYEAAFKERMESQNISKLHIEKTAVSHMSIKPDEETVSMARLAARNGVVKARGKDGAGKPLEEATNSAHAPLIEDRYYDPDVESLSGAFVRVSKEILQKFMNFYN